ncbi:DUF2336 domain-containing protein [Stappia sp. MMSF_3263]|uniref:DUF2336 domain-containing protein n=1 Tax=Stappia sp. MMSF_3263 TaxID=3046693 RepID=UPI00273EA464|nr:DUF2336 domain-containing protein [Stappia sp. MMSF_3263]
MNAVQLTELAREGSAESSGELVTALTDLFLRAGEDERDRVSLIFGDVVLRVLDRLQVEARTGMSEKICVEAGAPKNLLKALAADEDIGVAKPVLERNRTLADDELAEVAGTVSGAHLSLICKRQGLKPVLTRVIAQRGDPAILCQMLGNAGAAIGADSFDLLVARARKDSDLQNALCERKDLPETAAERLVPFLSKEQAQRIREQNANPTLVKAIAERTKNEVEIQLREFQGAKSKTATLIDGAIDGSVPMDVAVGAFADKERAFDLGQLLARKVGWPENVVVPLVYREEEQPLFFLCRLSGVSDEAYVKIARMRGKRMRLSSAAASESSRKYAALSLEEAVASFKAMAKKLKLPVAPPGA